MFCYLFILLIYIYITNAEIWCAGVPVPLFSSSAGLRVGLQAKRTLGKNYLAFQVASDAMEEK